MDLLRGVAIGIGVIIVALFALGGPEGIVALVAKADFSDRQVELVDQATAPPSLAPEDPELAEEEQWEEGPAAIEEETTIIE